MKKCTKCRIDKDESEFRRDSQKSDGLYSSCKACVSLWVSAHKEYYRDKKREYREKDEHKIRTYRREYYLKNVDQEKEAAKLWAGSNRLKRRISESSRRAAKRRSSGKYGKEDVEALLSLQKWKCACCKGKVGKIFHIDHVMPLSKGGSNSKDNLQILCPTCNMQKKDKHPVKFMQEKGFLL